MQHPRLTAAARQANPGAIAELIRVQLPPGCRVEAQLLQANSKSMTLRLMLTANYHLKQAETLHQIADVLGTLQLPLSCMEVATYLPHETSPVWHETLTQNTPPRSGKSQQSGIPDWLAAKPNLQTYRQVLEQNFDLAKLGLVVPFILYGLCFAKHYNVADFLAGNIRILQFLHGVNLIFHEAGHVLFMPFGQLMAILGGSLNQILIPAIISGYFFFKQQKYSGAITLFWVGENFWDVSVYASDGRYTVLPLLGGDGTTHDWNWLLTTLGWLPQTKLVSSLIYATGTLVYIGAIGLAVYFAQKKLGPTPR